MLNLVDKWNDIAEEIDSNDEDAQIEILRMASDIIDKQLLHVNEIPEEDDLDEEDIVNLEIFKTEIENIMNNIIDITDEENLWNDHDAVVSLPVDIPDKSAWRYYYTQLKDHIDNFLNKL